MPPPAASSSSSSSLHPSLPSSSSSDSPLLSRPLPSSSLPPSLPARGASSNRWPNIFLSSSAGGAGVSWYVFDRVGGEAQDGTRCSGLASQQAGASDAARGVNCPAARAKEQSTRTCERHLIVDVFIIEVIRHLVLVVVHTLGQAGGCRGSGRGGTSAGGGGGWRRRDHACARMAAGLHMRPPLRAPLMSRARAGGPPAPAHVVALSMPFLVGLWVLCLIHIVLPGGFLRLIEPAAGRSASAGALWGADHRALTARYRRSSDCTADPALQ